MENKWNEQLEEINKSLAELAEKVKRASEDAKAAGELGKEVIDDKIGTAKGDVEALKENLRIKGEQDRSKLSSSLLKAQMTVEAKIQDMKAAKDKRDLERYIEHGMDYIDGCFYTALYLIGDAELTMLEVLNAAEEYKNKYGSEDAGEDQKTEA